MKDVYPELRAGRDDAHAIRCQWWIDRDGNATAVTVGNDRAYLIYGFSHADHDPDQDRADAPGRCPDQILPG